MCFITYWHESVFLPRGGLSRYRYLEAAAWTFVRPPRAAAADGAVSRSLAERGAAQERLAIGGTDRRCTALAYPARAQPCAMGPGCGARHLPGVRDRAHRQSRWRAGGR